ncbi:hypothetical protein EST38_g10905 [Candolleomyces aberdarensis]|uniref:Uncharacterized protein n=1 Tax=Candolleomyces aberdarensis TaxID=2316362 RepID=A0A4Q2D6W9_9AGAR|nr:hypothetical protein EST38_g10905 [Candolleomyces aberdarensis]
MPPPTPSRPTSPERTAEEGASMDNLTRYERRALKGHIYDQIMDKIACLNQQWIASGSVVHGRNYHCRYITAKTNNGWDKLIFSTDDGRNGSEEFRTCIFGEMGGTNSGTAMGARGNFYIGREGDSRVIEDGTTVRNVYMLRFPTEGHPALRAAWDNQIFELNNAYNNIVNEFDLEDKSFKGIVAGDPRGDDFSIRAAGVPIYKNLGRASTGRSAVPTTPTTKRTVISTSSIASLRKGETSSAEASSDGVGAAPGSRANYIEGNEVTEDTTFDVHCLRDYGGNLFQHRHSVVVQPRIIDSDNETLVRPWEIPTKLKPGTLVLMEGTFSVWFIPGGNPFTASAIKILDESDEEPQLPRRYDETMIKAPMETSAPKRLSAFDDFGSPVKKAKKPASTATGNKNDGAKNKGKAKAKV